LKGLAGLNLKIPFLPNDNGPIFLRELLCDFRVSAFRSCHPREILMRQPWPLPEIPGASPASGLIEFPVVIDGGIDRGPPAAFVQCGALRTGERADDLAESGAGTAGEVDAEGDHEGFTRNG
jgi:hypothetical protein